jgi:hypothetical protein
MAERGRRSGASPALVSASAPAELTKEEAEAWNTIVAAEPADWFSASTRPLLAQYCRHIAAANRTAKLLDALQGSIAEMASEAAANGASPMAVMISATEPLDRLQKMQERESRAIASLATKMRITQQATINKRGNKIGSKKPWEF